MSQRFSVILATRDRPALFAEALESVLAQRYTDYEIIVVNDGSNAEHLAAYHTIWNAAAERLGGRFQALSLIHRPKGHGQSYSLNFGASHAKGEYLCFLDDDDKWTDPGHLERAGQIIDSAQAVTKPLDLYMTNQTAWSVDGKKVGTLWLGKLAEMLAERGQEASAFGSYTVGVEDLMATSGFCHLNCLIVRRTLYEKTGGMDEGIRWECDRDIYLRLIDQAQHIQHHPAVVSYHRVPDPAKSANMTTALGMVEKRLLQVTVLDKAVTRAHHPLIRAHARRHKAYALQKIATEFAAVKDWTTASHYALQALGIAPSPSWMIFTLRCALKRAINRTP